MLLAECDRFHGNTTLHEENPPCAVHETVLYMPTKGQNLAEQRSHGLYGLDGALIPGAGWYIGPERRNAGRLPFTVQAPQGLPERGGPFFYMGAFTNHYGHFLIDTLNRFWAWERWRRPGMKILTHDQFPAAHFFAKPFVADVFGVLGLEPEDFVTFDRPLLLHDVVVPYPAFEELNFAHRAFARFFNEVGRRLCPGPVERNDTPVYMTKAAVKSGISHYVNELPFAARLAAAGVDIVAPETLPLVEQVRLFRARPLVSGLIGSALHTSVFAPPGNMLALNYGRILWTNQVLIDRANGNRSVFVYDGETTRKLDRDEEFHNNYLMAEPERLAEEFLHRLNEIRSILGLGVGASPAVVPSSCPAPGKTVAVVLVVKDEASDILAWLAWYRLLGFDAAIVYDDDSADGTWELLQEAARHWDVRLSRTFGDRTVHYQKRQWDSYRHALATYKDEFAWLAFFDADEYLQLRQDQSVTAFLAHFPHADEVAVNWCNYGSSGHVLKPQAPPPLAYTWHGNAMRGVNRHVKCFVRPGKVGPEWLGVHCFDIAPERAVLAGGAPVAWSETLGIIAGAPDWSVAKLMHYQCRSMEHFVERLKKRPQFQDVPNLWGAYDMRDEEDTTPQALAKALLAGIEALRAPQPEQAAPPMPTRPDNISRGKRATQSSHCSWSHGATLEEDAARALNGVLDGTRKFHTDIEENPWWQVDLGGIATITEIHIHNARDHAQERFRDFSLSVSIDGSAWVELAEKRDDMLLAEPYMWHGPGTAWARYVRVTLLGRNYLHLDQVEVFGRLP